MATEIQDPSEQADRPSADAEAWASPSEAWDSAERGDAATIDGTEDGRVITIGWQFAVLALLAIAAVVGGVVVGRRYSVARSAAAAVAASQAQVAPMGVAPADAAPGVMPGVVLDPAPDAMPGVAPDQVIELPPSIHILRGKPAPPLEMTRLDTGDVMKLSDLAGRPVLVNFWATWCPPCRLEMPWLQSVHEKYADQGFVVLAVDAGERVPADLAPDLIREFVESVGLTVPVLHGDNTYDVQGDWTVIGLPASFLVGRDGTVVDVHTGAYPNEPTLDHHIQEILAPDE